MSEAFESIKRGLEEAIQYAEGNTQSARTHLPAMVDVKAVRQKIGLTQAEFATTLGVGLGTLQCWERGVREPRGPALVLLNLVSKEPQTILN
ncbi:MAG: NadS family protein [bacterium]|nr:NadS family protein [bacterium]